jgi:DnaJ-class molecular chaperone
MEMINPIVLPVIRIERHEGDAPKRKRYRISCSACNGSGSQGIEEGPAGTTWTVYKTCRVCKGLGGFSGRR